MQIEVVAGFAPDIVCETLIVGIPETASFSENVDIQQIDQVLGGKIGVISQEQPNCTRYGETTVIHTFGSVKPKQIVLLGLGKADALSIDRIRALSAIAARTVNKLSVRSAAIVIPYIANRPDEIQAIAEGALLGVYEFTHYKSNKEAKLLQTIAICVPSDTIKELGNAVQKGIVIAESVCLARDLVNHPACYMTPSHLANHAKEIAQAHELDLDILQAEELQRQGLTALLSVAKGSEEPPALLVLTYRGNPQSRELLGLVGKGITFDSGGISLKPSEGMGEMKDDMGGAAAVLAAMQAIGQLKPKCNISAVIPCAENMPSGRALKPGDVIRSLGGKTIEIVSTDAEGRLILADAISYARKIGATKLIDLATLTGACVVALGKTASALITNDDTWCRTVLDAATATGEKMWKLPAFEEYKELIKSDIADLKNSGGRPAGAITAGLFLAEFAEDTPWVHIDIAGTVTSEKPSGYNVKGATGVGVRTLIQIAQAQ